MGNGAIIPIRHDNISCNPVPCFEKNQWFEGPVQSHSIAPCWTSAPPNSQDHGLADPGDASLSGNRNREPSTLNPKPKPLNPTHRLMLPEPRNPIYTGNWALGALFPRANAPLAAKYLYMDPVQGLCPYSILRGSWDSETRVISKVTILIPPIEVPITLVAKSHDPLSRTYGFGNSAP